MYLQLIWTGVNCHNLLKNLIALTFYNISYDQIKYSDLHWVAVCTITSRSHGNGKTDIGLSNLDMPTKRVSFSHSPTTAIMKNVYLLTEVNNTRVGRNPSFFCFYHPLFFSDKSCFFASQNLFFWEGTFLTLFFQTNPVFLQVNPFFSNQLFCGLCANKIIIFFSYSRIT